MGLPWAMSIASEEALDDRAEGTWRARGGHVDLDLWEEVLRATDPEVCKASFWVDREVLANPSRGADGPTTGSLTNTPWSMQHGLLHSLRSVGRHRIHQKSELWKHISLKFCNPATL
ncbi:uncharacterized protein LOC144110108 [Amblyomma americanum]